MNDSKHYIIIDLLSRLYRYNVDNSTFTSDISMATLRTYKESEIQLISIYFHKPSMVRRCEIRNIRKIKLDMLNNI